MGISTELIFLYKSELFSSSSPQGCVPGNEFNGDTLGRLPGYVGNKLVDIPLRGFGPHIRISDFGLFAGFKQSTLNLIELRLGHHRIREIVIPEKQLLLQRILGLLKINEAG